MSRSAVVVLALALATGGCLRYMDPQQQDDGGAGADLTGADLFSGSDTTIPGEGPTPDPDLLFPPDMLVPDQLPVPDGGCPDGMTQCGSICADTKTDKLHCGGCEKACEGNADACVGGKCVCGTLATGCSDGLNCVKGACLCLKGGLCTGCCETATKCVALSTQTDTNCGKGGAACQTCADTNACTKDECTQGSCVNSPLSGTLCDDSLGCTNPDTCKKGVCLGTPLAGNCVISNTCYAEGAYKTAAQCLQCLTSHSATAWTEHANPGCVTTFAGIGYKGHVDGPNLSAKFKDPKSVAVSASGVVYVADQGNNCIRKIETGQVSSIGTGVWGYADGAATTAQFASPGGIAVSGSTGVVYVADSSNNRIRTIDASGNVATLAGNGNAGHLDGPAASAKFKAPHGVDIDDATGTVYVADRDNHVIRTIQGGSVQTFAGTPGISGSTNGALAVAQFANPYDLAYHAKGIFVADKLNSLIRVISGTTVSTHAGSSQGYQDGPAATAMFMYTYGLGLLTTTSSNLAVLVADGGNNRIRQVESGNVTTLAGDGGAGLVNGPAMEAQFNSPQDVAADASGKIYIVDLNNHCIRLYTPLP